MRGERTKGCENSWPPEYSDFLCVFPNNIPPLRPMLSSSAEPQFVFCILWRLILYKYRKIGIANRLERGIPLGVTATWVQILTPEWNWPRHCSGDSSLLAEWNINSSSLLEWERRSRGMDAEWRNCRQSFYDELIKLGNRQSLSRERDGTNAQIRLRDTSVDISVVAYRREGGKIRAAGCSSNRIVAGGVLCWHWISSTWITVKQRSSDRVRARISSLLALVQHPMQIIYARGVFWQTFYFLSF